MSALYASSLATNALAPAAELIVHRLGARSSHDWVRRVIALLDAVVGQLDHEQAAYGAILKAASLLRMQIDPELAKAAPCRRGGLLPWQERKVRAYIDSHITGPVLVADLCALVQLSEAHFSRAFKRTFGKSPHAFVIGRRVELAAQYILQTGAPLSDIALRCGFTDQSHLCKHFRLTTGQTPAAWRRAHSEDVWVTDMCRTETSSGSRADGVSFSADRVLLGCT